MRTPSAPGSARDLPTPPRRYHSYTRPSGGPASAMRPPSSAGPPRDLPTPPLYRHALPADRRGDPSRAAPTRPVVSSPSGPASPPPAVGLEVRPFRALT